MVCNWPGFLFQSMNSLKEEQRKQAEEQGGFTKEMAMLQQESMKQAVSCRVSTCA